VKENIALFAPGEAIVRKGSVSRRMLRDLFIVPIIPAICPSGTTKSTKL